MASKTWRPTVHLTEEHRDFLKGLAWQNGTNISTEVKRLIEDEMKRRPEIMKVLSDARKDK